MSTQDAQKGEALPPKDVALMALVDLLRAVEAGAPKIPGFAFVAYPELKRVRDAMEAARVALSQWQGG
jgi:hypothetical protein